MITFYSMNGCPHCVNALKALENDIRSGTVVVKSHTEAPPTARGFPYFATENGNETTGFVNRETLLQKLGKTPIIEGYKQPHKQPQPHPHKQPHHPHKQPHHPHKQPHHPHQDHNQEPEICKRSGGYVTLSDTWRKQKSYIA